MQVEDEEMLPKPLHPYESSAERSQLLIKEENELFDCAISRFRLGDGIADRPTILSVMSNIASDGRESASKSDVPSIEALWEFLARCGQRGTRLRFFIMRAHAERRYLKFWEPFIFEIESGSHYKV